MGYSRFSTDDWKSYTTTKSYATKSTKEIFTKSSMDKDLDPKNIDIRESRDSDINPNSNAIILGLDVTGSMGVIADTLARQGLPKLVNEIYDRKPITDPHIMCMGIGDVICDSAPLQVTQFEAGAVELVDSLEKIYLEHGGGGNRFESYALAWYFAGLHTSIDCFEKRNKKGYLFTIGDEEPTPKLSASDIARFLKSTPQADLDCDQLLAMAEKKYNVFHLMVEQGHHMRYSRENVVNKWTELLGQRAILLSDYNNLSEVIVSIIQVNEGEDKDKVTKSWDGSTSMVVSRAIESLTVDKVSNSGVVTFD